MPSGVPTPNDVEILFRTHYLRTGNIRASARQAKIPETTGQELANRAQADADFVQARAALYARALPDAERMLMTGLEVASDRLEAGPESVASLSDSGASKITIQDPGPAYLRAIADGTKVLAMIRKGADVQTDAKPVEVHVHLKPEKSDDGSGSK